MSRQRGTEYTGVPELVPSGQSIPKKQGRGLANQGGGSNIVPPLNAPAIDDKQWPVVYTGVTSNQAGTGIEVYDLSTVNAIQFNLGYSFPGATDDDNQWTVAFVMPSNYDNTRQIEMWISVVAE